MVYVRLMCTLTGQMGYYRISEHACKLIYCYHSPVAKLGITWYFY